MPHHGIFGLPTELFFIISHHSRSEDLLNLAKTCRCMNDIALPIFMRRMHLPLDPERKKCIVDFNLMSWDAGLGALAIYFSQANLQTFVCILSKQNLRGSNSRFLSRRVDQVSFLMSLILSVENVYMVFDVDLGRLTYLQHLPMQRLMLAVHDFVGLSMRKSCSSFHIADLYAYPFQKAYEFQAVDNFIASRWQNFTQFCMDALPLSRTRKRQLRGNGWKYRKHLESNLLPRPFLPSIPSPNYLTRMDLNCHFLLVPPFATWTFDLLKSSNITSLTLSLTKPMKEEEFRRHLLPRIVASLPQLVELNAAYDEPVFFESVVGALHLFPRLRSITFAPLSFDRISPLPVINTTPSRNISLHHLTSFTGFSEQAAFLFSHPFSLPSLANVNIIIDWYYNYHVSLNDLSWHFSIMNRRLSKLKINPCVSVCMADHDRCPISPTPSDHQEFVASFDAVTRLTIELPYFLPEVPSQIEDVLAWLRLFRRLRELTLCISCLKANSADTSLRYAPAIAAIKAALPYAEATPVYNHGNYHHHWSNSRGPKERIFCDLPSSIPHQLQNCLHAGSFRTLRLD